MSSDAIVQAEHLEGPEAFPPSGEQAGFWDLGNSTQIVVIDARKAEKVEYLTVRSPW